jgi:hypothetical protein
MNNTHVYTRKATNKLLEMIEEGVLDRDALILGCLHYMSEADVADMARCEGFIEEEEEDDEDEADEDDAEDQS